SRPTARSPAARVSKTPSHRIARGFLDPARTLLAASYRQKFATKRATDANSRSDPAYEFLIGPSVNIRPTHNTFVTVSPQFSVTDDSLDAKVFVIAGFNFSFGGPRAPSEEGIRVPASMFGR